MLTAEDEAWRRGRTEGTSARLDDILQTAGLDPAHPATQVGLAAYREFWEPHTFTHPNIPEVWEWLRDNGIRVGVLSNTIWSRDYHREIFERDGLEAYQRYQIEHEEQILAPGDAFPLVHKLLGLNNRLPGEARVEGILLSRNSADTGLRVFNAIKHYGLDITRAAFTKGEPTSRYVPAFGAHLFLSADTGDVRRALDDVGKGVAYSEKAG
mgnify:CR=1 FL=1